MCTVFSCIFLYFQKLLILLYTWEKYSTFKDKCVVNIVNMK